MARSTLYSRSRRPAATAPVPATARGAPPAAGDGHADPSPHRGEAPAAAALGSDTEGAREAPGGRSGWRGRTRRALARHERWAWATGALLLALAAGWPAWRPQTAKPLKIEQIDSALRESLMQDPLPSLQAQAVRAIAPSVVRVIGRSGPPDEDEGKGPANDKDGKADQDSGQAGPRGRDAAKADRHAAPGKGPVMPGRSVGTGVVIVESGAILTNLHVVAGAERIEVTFADGSSSPASVVHRQPHNDLAVLQPRILPDDLRPATMRSTADLQAGDRVVAVGFPFGIGPSASAGVVSGLGREFKAPDGREHLKNLIQFDAAANPGNSGGPLVTLDGAVVGIVTAIMNPEGHSTFIGIGFAVPIESAAAAVGMPPF